MNQTDLFKPNRNELANPLEHSTISDFISRIADKKNATAVQAILDHPLFAELNGKGSAIARTKEDEVELSQAAQDVLTNLSSELNGYLNDFFNSPDTVNFNANGLTENLKAIVDNAETEVAFLSGISNEEVTALLGALQMQRELIPSIVENANSMFESTPTGGRTKGFFKKLGRYVGSVLVSATAAAIVGGMIGAIWDEPFKGVAIGAGVGAVIGIYQATQNKCADSWNFQDRIPFVYWVDLLLTMIRISTILFLVSLSVLAPAQEMAPIFSSKAKLNLFNGPKIFPFAVKGKIELTKSGFVFYPTDNSAFYQYNSLIRTLDIEVGSIRGIRRNWFFIIPNRIVIKTSEGKKYRFYLPRKRKHLINLVRQRKSQLN